MRRVLLAALASTALLACTQRPEGAAPVCQCADGQLCQDGQCVDPCNRDSDCGDGEVCRAGVCQDQGGPSGGCQPACGAGYVCQGTTCVPESQSCNPPCGAGFACVEATSTCVPVTSAPRITAVNGTGSQDQDTEHTPNHLRDRLVVTGTALAGASFQLRGTSPVRPAVSLGACGAGSDTQIELALPTSLAAGEYLLTAVNQVGSCDSTVWLLQGEPGTDGTGSGLPGLVTTLVAEASGAASGRSVRVDDVPAGDGSTLPGLSLVVIDLQSHAVIDEPVGPFLSTHMTFNAQDAVQREGLRDVLGTLSSSQAIVLTSGGDITPMLTDPVADLPATLRDFGASALFDGVAAGEGYVLVGVRGIGEGNGLERVGTALTVSTVLIDGGIVGLRQMSPPDPRYVNADGDTVTGTLTFEADPVFNDGAIPASKLAPSSIGNAQIAFNYAGSASQGGPASDLACAGCVGADEVAFSYAASATQGGAAADVACTGCIQSGEVSDLSWSKLTGVPGGFADGVDDGLTVETDPSVNALGKATLGCAAGQLPKFDGTVWSCADDHGAPGGPAAVDLACSGCVAGSDIADGTIAGVDVQNGSIQAVDVAFNYAASSTQGGAATDVACTGCIALGTETAGTYDSTSDTIADDGTISGAEITDASVAPADVSFNYAASTAKGGAASDVECAGCITLGTETAGTYDATSDTIADDGTISEGEAADALSLDNGLLFAPASGAAVGIGTSAPSAKALLELSSTTRGFLPPRLTTTQRDAITTPPAGLTIYNSTTGAVNVFDGTVWRVIDMTTDVVGDDGTVIGAEITDGTILAVDVGFNFAGSSSKGGAASDVTCSSCVALGTETSGTFDSTADTIADDNIIASTEVNFNYAGSLTKGGAASDLACPNCVALGSETTGTYDATADTIADDDAISGAEVSDGSITAADVSILYAASAVQGGAAADLECASCVTLGTETNGTYDSTGDTIADDGVIQSAEVDFTYAASASKGGAASDVACTNCITLGAETAGTYDSTADSIADDGLIDSAEIATDTIVAADIATSAVGTAEIADGSVGSADVADGSLSGTDIADGSIGSADLADNTVSSADIANGTIVDADMANMSYTKISGARNALSFCLNGNGQFTNPGGSRPGRDFRQVVFGAAGGGCACWCGGCNGSWQFAGYLY